ncbi:ChW repeat-containing protein [[Clostridium] sordellii]|nr:ChW repeat-containing protein [[Clostridium] sordellii] [Paeniclostridium sordellii]
MSNNSIVLLDPLSNLTDLIELDLSYNQIKLMGPLSSLTKLIKLNLSYNQITDISKISKLTRLEILSLEKNKIKNIEPLSKLKDNLINLNLMINSISDISPLSNFKVLKKLMIDRNKIDTISLSNLSSIEWLSLNGNQIVDLSPLNQFPTLTRVEVMNNKISDISPLKDFRTNKASAAIYLDNQNLSNDTEITTKKTTADVENIIQGIDGKVQPVNTPDEYTYNAATGLITFKNVELGTHNRPYKFNTKFNKDNVLIRYNGSVTNTITRLEDRRISVTVPTKMAFQVVSNTNNGVPELASGNYKIINNSEYKDINVYLESFTKSGGDFSVIKGTPVSGNNQVEMNLNLNTNNTNDIQIYDNFNKSTPLGKLKYKRDNSTENTMNLKFTGGDKIETGKDENIAGKTFKNQFKFVFKFENVN